MLMLQLFWPSLVHHEVRWCWFNGKSLLLIWIRRWRKKKLEWVMRKSDHISLIGCKGRQYIWQDFEIVNCVIRARNKAERSRIHLDQLVSFSHFNETMWLHSVSISSGPFLHDAGWFPRNSLWRLRNESNSSSTIPITIYRHHNTTIARQTIYEPTIKSLKRVIFQWCVCYLTV